MHIKTHIIRAGDFVRSRTTGELDFDRSQNMLMQALAAANDKVICDILLDLREVKEATVTATEITRLAATLTHYPSFYWRKVAILLPPDAPGVKAAEFQNRARGLGFQVEAFKDFEKAIYWLSIIREVAASEFT